MKVQKPSSEANVQQKSELHTGVKTKDNNLSLKQKALMKGIDNPLDKIEADIAAEIKHTTVESQIKAEDEGTSLKKSGKDNFNAVFNQMNNYVKEGKHSSLEDEKQKLGGI